MDIHEASRLGDEKRVADLIAQGVDVNKPDQSGLTPLHHAGQSRSPKIHELLLKGGANPNARDNRGRTPFFEIEFGSYYSHSMITSLIIYGADPYDRDNEGYLAGHSHLEWMGVYSRFPERIVMLLAVSIRILLEAADLKLTEDNQDDAMYIKMGPILEEECFVARVRFAQLAYEDEVTRLKSTHLTNSITYYDILHIDLVQHLQNESSRASLEAIDLKDFPGYEGLIKKKIENAKRKFELLPICMKCFTGFLEIRCNLGVMLPEELTRRILMYLNKKELESLLFTLSPKYWGR